MLQDLNGIPVRVSQLYESNAVAVIGDRSRWLDVGRQTGDKRVDIVYLKSQLEGTSDATLRSGGNGNELDQLDGKAVTHKIADSEAPGSGDIAATLGTDHLLVPCAGLFEILRYDRGLRADCSV